MPRPSTAISTLAFLVAASAQAQDLQLFCTGDVLGWSLALDGAVAEMTIGTATQMEVVHETRAEGADWPRALTLIGERDTAIVILDPRQCAADPDAALSAQVLTQRGQSPIFLTGCCRSLE